MPKIAGFPVKMTKPSKLNLLTILGKHPVYVREYVEFVLQLWIKIINFCENFSRSSVCEKRFKGKVTSMKKEA